MNIVLLYHSKIYAGILHLIGQIRALHQIIIVMRSLPTNKLCTGAGAG